MTSLIKLHKEPIMKENTVDLNALNTLTVVVEKVDLKKLDKEKKEDQELIEKYAKITREYSEVFLDFFLRVTSAKNRELLGLVLERVKWGKSFGIASKDIVKMMMSACDKNLNIYNRGVIDEDLIQAAVQPIITATIKRLFKDENAGLGRKRPVVKKNDEDEVDDEEKVYPPHKVVKCTNKKCQGIMKVTYVGEDGRTYKARPDSWEERFGVVGDQCTCSR